VAPAAAALLLLLSGALVVRAAHPAVPNENHDVAAWLVSRNLTTGVGSYWSANNITVATSGRIRVAPLIGRPLLAYRWESRGDWYDPARNDARFVVLDLRDDADHRTVDAAVEQFGPPLEHHDFGHYGVLVYDHNLLVGLRALCGPDIAASMAACSPNH
jgi:hypothetical protein